MAEVTDHRHDTETVAERVRRLEMQLAAAQDTARLEEQLAEKVVARITKVMAATGYRNGPPPDGLAAADSTGVGGLVVPSAVVQANLQTLAVQAAGTAAKGFWERLGLVRELRLMSQMFFDPRYRTSRWAQVGAPVVVGLMVMNYFFVGQAPIPLVAPIVERLFLIVLAVALYKILSREAARYAEVLAYLARYGG